MQKEVVSGRSLPKAAGPYSQAVKLGGWVFLSGQIPVDPATGELVGGDISLQTGRVMENIKSILAAADVTLADVVKTSVYLKDLNDFARMNEVYGRYFTRTPPARTTVGVASLPKGAGVEIDAIAFSPR